MMKLNWEIIGVLIAILIPFLYQCFKLFQCYLKDLISTEYNLFLQEMKIVHENQITLLDNYNQILEQLNKLYKERIEGIEQKQKRILYFNETIKNRIQKLEKKLEENENTRT